MKAAVCFVVFLFMQFSYANELWVKQSSTSREYFTIENTDQGLVVKKYRQQKDDFQEHTLTKPFKNQEDAVDFIKDKGGFKKIDKLESWPIKQAPESKGLFGKKNQVIWETRNQWSDEWETKYAAWIQQNVGTDFYQKYKIATDCADALVGLRWIYSRINGLPVANTVADTGELFGNFSMPRKWQKLDTADNWYEDELFKTALSYIMDLASSRTVVQDGFPVRIDQTGLIAGDFIVTQNHGSGHVRIINETHYGEVTELPFYTLASTTPRAVRALVKETFVDPEWPTHMVKEILAFRWPVNVNGKWVLLAPEKHSRYSMEQYDLKLRETYPAFISFILSRVKETFDPVKLVQLGATEISDYIKQRIDVVNQGYAVCKNSPCKPNSDEWEDWSTTSRDQKLLKKFTDLDQMVEQFETLSPGLYDFWINQLRNTTVNVLGIDVTLANVRYLFEHNFTSIDPNVSPEERWGLNSKKALGDWFANIETLLNKRNDAISQINAPCTSGCFPKNEMWLEGNTYQIDTELNNLYVDVASYCHVIGPKNCKAAQNSVGAKILTFNGMSQSLSDWFNTIPYFHSDPRVSFSRRWGILSGKSKALALPYFEIIKISKNSLALLDNKLLINLETGDTLYEAPKDTRMVLTDVGLVYLIIDTTGTIKQVKIDNNSISLADIADNGNILSQNKERRISYFEDGEVGIFKKVLSNIVAVFRIKNGATESISNYTGKSMKIGPMLSMVQNQSTITFADLDKNKIFEFTVPLTEQFRDMNKVNLLSYTYPILFLEYKDQDYALHYPLKVNLETKSWDVLDLGLSGPYEILWSSTKFSKAFIRNKFNDDFPELYGVDFKNAAPQVVRLDNNLVAAMEGSDRVYLIESKGSQWSQDLQNKIMSWNNQLSELSSNSYGNPKFLTSKGIYFSSDAAGTFLTFGKNQAIKMPKGLISPDDFYNVQLGVPEVLTYRFDTSYGDFWNMGGAINVQASDINLNEELTPEFSLYTWIKKEDLLNQRWQKSFMDSTVKAGALISIGKNLGVWWRLSE